jgi:nicotinamidase-related amidase
MIPRENVVAVVVDIQERLFPHIHEHDRLAVNVKKLIKGLKILKVPLIVTQQYTKGLGQTITPVAEALGEFEPLEKVTFSCYGDPDFVNILSASGKNHIILMGIETHVCVMQTAMDLLDIGYEVIIIEDCVSSRRLNDKQVALKRMRDDGVIITTYESILFELLNVAGTEEFKAISNLVK